MDFKVIRHNTRTNGNAYRAKLHGRAVVGQTNLDPWRQAAAVAKQPLRLIRFGGDKAIGAAIAVYQRVQRECSDFIIVIGFLVGVVMEDALYTSRVQQICRVVYFGGLAAAGLWRECRKFSNPERILLAVVASSTGRFHTVCDFCCVQTNLLRFTRTENKDS